MPFFTCINIKEDMACPCFTTGLCLISVWGGGGQFKNIGVAWCCCMLISSERDLSLHGPALVNNPSCVLTCGVCEDQLTARRKDVRTGAIS